MLPRPAGRHRAQAGPRCDRDVVRRRSSGRPEERHHSPMGTAREQALAAAGQRYASTYIVCTVCRQEDKGAALALRFCNTAAMSLHSVEISPMVSPDRHAVPLLNQAGWFLSRDVAVRDNITLLPPSPKCPELNVMKNVWQFMRDNSLSNRVFRDQTTSSITAAITGTASAISPGASTLSACAHGLVGSDQWDLVKASRRWAGEPKVWTLWAKPPNSQDSESLRRADSEVRLRSACAHSRSMPKTARKLRLWPALALPRMFRESWTGAAVGARERKSAEASGVTTRQPRLTRA